MSNELSKLIERQGNQLGVNKNGFVIDDDKKAEWALHKIAIDEAKFSQEIEACQYFINYYQERLNEVQEQKETKSSWLLKLLADYFETVHKKSTKTQETYSLPSGKLKRKFGITFERDDIKLLDWLNKNAPEYIRTEKKVDWSRLKEETEAIEGGTLIYKATGEIIEGVEVVEKPPVFTVEIKS